MVFGFSFGLNLLQEQTPPANSRKPTSDCTLMNSIPAFLPYFLGSIFFSNKYKILTHNLLKNAAKEKFSA